jgi:MFS superfamily sulfate permease-like transporter
MCARRGERRTTCRQRSGDLRVAIVTLAFLTGLLCIAASFLRLGALADFLSRPILVGFLNGVALSIILGQADKIFGFRWWGAASFHA